MNKISTLKFPNNHLCIIHNIFYFTFATIRLFDYYFFICRICVIDYFISRWRPDKDTAYQCETTRHVASPRIASHRVSVITARNVNSSWLWEAPCINGRFVSPKDERGDIQGGKLANGGRTLDIYKLLRNSRAGIIQQPEKSSRWLDHNLDTGD